MLVGIALVSAIVIDKHTLDERIERLRTQKTGKAAWNLNIGPRHLAARLFMHF